MLSIENAVQLKVMYKYYVKNIYLFEYHAITRKMENNEFLKKL